jgi:type IV secretion system protein VirB3
MHAPSPPAISVKDTLFQGVTRPAMLLGVTYEAAVINFLVTAMAFLGSGRLVMLLVCLPIHLVCYVVCIRDVRFFGLFHLWVRTGGRSRTRMFWNATTLAPLPDRRAASRAIYLVDAAKRG